MDAGGACRSPLQLERALVLVLVPLHLPVTRRSGLSQTRSPHSSHHGVSLQHHRTHPTGGNGSTRWLPCTHLRPQRSGSSITHRSCCPGCQQDVAFLWEGTSTALQASRTWPPGSPVSGCRDTGLACGSWRLEAAQLLSREPTDAAIFPAVHHLANPKGQLARMPSFLPLHSPLWCSTGTSPGPAPCAAESGSCPRNKRTTTYCPHQRQRRCISSVSARSWILRLGDSANGRHTSSWSEGPQRGAKCCTGSAKGRPAQQNLCNR